MPSTPRRKCSVCGINRNPNAYTTPKARVCNTCKRKKRRVTARASHVERTYGITQEEYDAILAAQGGVCGGCGGSRNYNLPVDHDHNHPPVAKTNANGDEIAEFDVRGSVRGLLCKRCNGALRDVHDDPAVLLGLWFYLLNPPARKVLGS